MNASKIIAPAIWLMVLISGLPQLSETIYTPSLPSIAQALNASAAMVEYTLTIYLFSFTFGILFWGRLSDKLGRKPCVLIGLSIFILGCIGCYSSTTITALMISRFVQAFGGSIGSVLGQAIIRDAFTGTALVHAYTSIGVALSLFPALGPIVGGFIAEFYGWSNIFLFLIAFTLLLMLFITLKLPETHPHHERSYTPLKDVLSVIIRDKKVLGYAFLVGAGWGMNFCYFAEAPFYLISLLGMSSSHYGLTFLGIASTSLLGNMIGKKLVRHYTPEHVIGIGALIVIINAIVFATLILCNQWFEFHRLTLIIITLISQMTLMFGVTVINGNALGIALRNYKWCTGTASSLFGFFYYSITVLFTFGMGFFHNGTLLTMPLYFLSLSLLMWTVNKTLLKEEISA